MAMDEAELERAFRERAKALFYDSQGHAELLARYINTFWFNRGKKMNARAVIDGSRWVVVSTSLNGLPLQDAE